jgi:DNA-binding NarL/FixJ family response regulator
VIRLLIVDDHHVLREGLSLLLAGVDDIEVIGAARDAHEALALADAESPDVVLMDLSMPGTDGIEVTRRLMAAHPDARVVVLTSFSDRERIVAAIDAGAIGYLLKDVEPGELVSGIRAAHRGESPLAPKAASAILSSRPRRTTVELTDREQEVLRLIGAGLANKVIAARLGIKEKTVKAHLTTIYQRIGVTDRTQAALWAHRQGIV